MLGRDGPENLRILKRVFSDWTIEERVGYSAVESWIRTVERCIWVFRISTDRDLRHHKMRRVWGWSQHSIVSKDF